MILSTLRYYLIFIACWRWRRIFTLHLRGRTSYCIDIEWGALSRNIIDYKPVGMKVFCLHYQGLLITEIMFRRYGSVLFRNKMKPFYWLIVAVTSILTNRTASFHFVSEQKGTVMYEHGLNSLQSLKCSLSCYRILPGCNYKCL